VESYRFCVSERLQLTIAFDEPDENGWIVARVLEVPGALSQGRSREDARTNVIEALYLLLTPTPRSREPSMNALNCLSSC
jgi:predicted RNase H-like HicB family nuclease